MSEEAERALWDKAVDLLESNRSFVPKEASLAFVGVMKTLVQGEIMPLENLRNKAEKEAA